MARTTCACAGGGGKAGRAVEEWKEELTVLQFLLHYDVLLLGKGKLRG